MDSIFKDDDSKEKKFNQQFGGAGEEYEIVGFDESSSLVLMREEIGSISTPLGIRMVRKNSFRQLECGCTWKPGVEVIRDWKGHIVCSDHSTIDPAGRIICVRCARKYFKRLYSSFCIFLLDRTIGARVFPVRMTRYKALPNTNQGGDNVE